jgi:hypothetical protein
MSFTQFTPSDFVISTDSITAPAWSSNVPTLTTFYKAPSIQTTTVSAGAYYQNVYQQAYGTNGAAVQFAIAYGNINGSGSVLLNNLVPGVTPSLTTYDQYLNLVYGPEISGSQGFNFGGKATNAPDIWALNVERNRYKQTLMPGTFNLSLSSSNGGWITLTDDSNDVTVVNYLDCGRVFNLVSGSYGKATNITPVGGIAPGYTASGSYGFFLPDIGTIILNASALNLAPVYGGISQNIDRINYGAPPVGYTVNASASYTSTNNTLMFQAISASAIYPYTTGSYPGFQLNSQENVSSDYVFVRINNAQYNYSSNPTFTSGSTGAVLFQSMIYSPQTFPTTVGLYNNNSELLAVAKLSQALVKDFTKEALIRVKLDW